MERKCLSPKILVISLSSRYCSDLISLSIGYWENAHREDFFSKFTGTNFEVCIPPIKRLSKSGHSVKSSYIKNIYSRRLENLHCFFFIGYKAVYNLDNLLQMVLSFSIFMVKSGCGLPNKVPVTHEANVFLNGCS